MRWTAIERRPGAAVARDRVRLEGGEPGAELGALGLGHPLGGDELDEGRHADVERPRRVGAGEDRVGHRRDEGALVGAEEGRGTLRGLRMEVRIPVVGRGIGAGQRGEGGEAGELEQRAAGEARHAQRCIRGGGAGNPWGRNIIKGGA
jgi:hypothetical protein